MSAQQPEDTPPEEQQRRAEERAAKYHEEVTRADVAALAVLVGELGANVRELHDLILESMIKSETAITTAENAPSRAEVVRERDEALQLARRERQRALLRVYLLLGVVTALVAVIAVEGAAFVVNSHRYQQGQYETCVERTEQIMHTAEQQRRSSVFL